MNRVLAEFPDRELHVVLDSPAIRLDQEKKVYQRRFKNRRITQL
jgi:hypothetical protein